MIAPAKRILKCFENTKNQEKPTITAFFSVRYSLNKFIQLRSK
jgi:hypothetical protein